MRGGFDELELTKRAMYQLSLTYMVPVNLPGQYQLSSTLLLSNGIGSYGLSINTHTNKRSS